jgi:hypothetical protein
VSPPAALTPDCTELIIHDGLVTYHVYSREQTRPDMRVEQDLIESTQDGSRTYSSSGGGRTYPSATPARINTSEKRLTLSDEDDELYKTPSHRTDLDSVEAGHFHQHRHEMSYDNDVIDIAKPSEAHKF